MGKPIASDSARQQLASVISFVTHPITSHKKIILGLSGLITLVAAPAAALSIHSSLSSLPELQGEETKPKVHIEQSTSANTSNPAPNTSDKSTVKIQTKSEGSESASSGSVTVNGQTSPLPANGTVEKTIPGNQSNSSVDISIQSSNSSQQTYINNQSSSSSSVEVYSHSTSTGDTASDIGPSGRNTLGR